MHTTIHYHHLRTRRILGDASAHSFQVEEYHLLSLVNRSFLLDKEVLVENRHSFKYFSLGRVAGHHLPRQKVIIIYIRNGQLVGKY